MKKVLLMLMVAALVVSAFAGCATSEKGPTEAPVTEKPTEAPVTPEPGPVVFNWNIGADPKTIDPGLNGASDGGDVINQTFEGLVREKSGVVQPGIAKEWKTSEDGLTITFTLRESKWSDGSPLTANDFVYSWLRGMDPATASEYSWIWEYTHVVGAKAFAEGTGTREEVGIKAVNDYTLEVKLESPTDYFVSLMSFYHFRPVKQSSVEAGPEGTWASNPDLAVCNGPFKLTEYTIGEGLVLEKNPEYWNAEAVNIDIINGKFIDDQSTAYNAYKNGDLDFLPEVPPAEVPTLMAEDPNFYVFPLLGTYYYSFNLDKKIWEDVRVRKAISMAINRELICETLASGQVPALGMVSPGFKDNEGRDFFETAGTYGLSTDASSVEQAKALLAEAGYPNGEGFPKFTILYNTGAGHELVATMVQEQLKTNLGIECDLANQEWAVFQDTRKEGNYELARGGWLTDFMDPIGMLGIFVPGNAYNDPNYDREEFVAAINAASAATDPAEHYAKLYEAQTIFMEDMPIIPVYHYTDVCLVSPRLQDWDRSVLGTIDFSTAKIVE